MAGSTYGDSAIVSGSIKIINEVVEPSPGGGEAFLYVKDDGKLYYKSAIISTPVELSTHSGGGGGGDEEFPTESEIIAISMLSG